MRAKKIARGVGWVVVSVVVGGLGLAVLALAVLRTEWGGNMVRNVAVPRVNRVISGRLELGGLRYRGSAIELRNIVLKDPEGKVVVSAARAAVAFSPSDLLRNRVHIDEVALDDPLLDLERTEKGLNLARAVAPRKLKEKPATEPDEPAADEKASDLEVIVERIALRGGTVKFRDLEPAGLPPIHLEQLQSSGNARLALGTSEMEAKLSLDGRTSAPVRSPLAVRVDARATGAKGNGSLRFDWAGSRIDLQGESRDVEHVDVAIKEIRVSPGLVRPFVPTYPVKPDLVLSGDARLRVKQLVADLSLVAGETRARLTADADIETARARSVKLDVKQIDLSKLLIDGPRSRFDLAVTGKGGGKSLEAAVGDLELMVPQGGSLSGTPFGPVRVAASADKGRFRLPELLAALPGLRLTGQGEGDVEQLAVDVRVDARDLNLLARSLALPSARRTHGRGTITMAIRGPVRAPGLNARVHLPLLRMENNTIEDLRLQASAEALGRPARAQGQLRVKSMRLGARKLDGIHGDLTSDEGGAFTASLGLAGPSPTTVRAAGKLTLVSDSKASRSSKSTAETRQVQLSKLTISHPRGRWDLAQTARIEVGEGFALTGLDLRSDPGQSIQATLRQEGKRVEGRVNLAALDLSRLPPLAVPAGKRLEGKVDLDARLRGRMPRPEVDVTLALTKGRYDRFGDLAVNLSARHRQGRATGDLKAHALGADHSARFDVPVVFPPAPATALTVDVAVGEIDLQRALAMLEHPLKDKVSGRAALALKLEGRASDPDLTVDGHTRGLRVDRDALGDIVLKLRDPQGGPFNLQVQASTFGQKSSVSLETPVVLGTWLRRPPEQQELMATPFQLRASVGRLPLAALTARPGKAPSGMNGTVSMEANLRGPVNRLTGTMSADARGVSVTPSQSHTFSGENPQSIPPTDGTLKVRLGEGADGVETQVRISRKGQVIGEVDATVAAPVRQLMDVDAVGKVPVKLDARLGPVVLQRVGPPAQIKKDSPRILRGRVDALVAFKGPLDRPSLDARLRVAEGHLGRTPLGGADIRLAYQERRSVIKASLASANGGKLVLDGNAQADLSLPSIRKGLVPRNIPVQASLSAQNFDLTFLSGLTDMVRAVAGQLEAQANVSGTAGTPQIAGRLAWRQGRLMLAGFGEFRDIDMSVKGDQQQMTLERLFARSGSGDANITAKAVREPDGQRLAVEAQAKLSRFRLYTEGQPIGALSLDASAKGRVAPDRINIATTIPEAHFELAEGDRKKLQPLKRPKDVVIVANGRPLDRDEARRHAELLEMQQALIQGSSQDDAEKTAKQKVAADRKKSPSGAVADERRMRVTVDAPRNLWIKGDDANIELGLDPNFLLISTDEPRLFGTVKVRRGQVKVFGRRFDVKQNSSVTFGGPIDTPRLSVDAVYRAEQAGATVQVHVEGPADRLTFNLRSPEHPDWGDSELITLIITGRQPGEEGGSSAPGDKAASLVGGLVANKLQKALSARLPLDVLTIEPGQDLAGTRLEAGTYLGDDLYVAYVGRVNMDPFQRENRNELHLEYQLSSRWSFEGTYGDLRRGSADLLWTKNY